MKPYQIAVRIVVATMAVIILAAVALVVIALVTPTDIPTLLGMD